jgi:hypothetical protein
MTPAALRRTYRAARTLDPIRTAAQQDRYDRAEATLRAALDQTHEAIALPGYRVYIDHDTRAVMVARSDITNAAQLALWRKERTA